MLSPMPPPPRPSRRWPRRLAQAAAGVALGLAIAEGAFRLRDRGAFPHLNAYVRDDRLGARLRPGASQRLAGAVPDDPVTSVRINRDGLRGAELPAPGDGEILVVGDSQVFGLGVEEHETASAELGRILGRAVINAGVPTYGPSEYNAVAEELLARRRAGVVVYVVNMVNDLFEASRPNVERHVVWDGWAVRRETAPEVVTAFPGREILFRRSHLVFALRSFLHARGPAPDERGFASEGTSADLLSAAARAGDERARADRENAARRAARDAEITQVTEKERAADLRLEELALDTFGLRPYEEGIAYQKSRDNPGDIVIKKKIYLEESRNPVQTATFLYNGAKVRREVEERIRAFAAFAAILEKDPNATPPRELWPILRVFLGPDGSDASFSFTASDELVRQRRGHPLVRTLEEREALKKRLDELRAAPAESVRAWSPLTPLLRQVKAACDARGAKLLVVALPMDLQVSPAEWAKYGATPIDMGPTKILLDDVVASAEALGAMGLDATAALAAAEPGAFLRGDFHLTPRGHRALAEALAAKLRGE
jgi:hypothetical protein